MGKYKGFTQVELRKPRRSMFDLSHESRVSTRLGKLTPVLCMETIPNDTFSVSTEVLIKLAPMIAPIFHRLNLYVHFFFIPLRLLWEDWEEFITGGRLGEAVDAPPIPPRVTIASVLALNGDYLDTGSLADYLGVPSIPDSTAATYIDGQTIDLMPFAAFFKVWMDYYRDRNFVPDDLYTLPMPSGTAATFEPLFAERYRGYQHDYFTSAQTETQRGPEVLMPMAVEIDYKTVSEVFTAAGTPATGDLVAASGDLSDGVNDARIENIESAENASVTINEFRRAIALQQWMERNQLAGSRYNESIWAHFNRRTSDGRLQRAEYLGGGKAVVKIDEVMTTSYSEDSDTNVVPPANPTGMGSAYSTTNHFRYNCEEHGFIIGVLSVMPTTAYMQGMPRMFTGRRTFLDYPWPTFANLGEQPVYDYEIFADATSLADIAGEDRPIFGYQSRYADWKHFESTAHGDFRTSLEHWHLVRKFATQPLLNDGFIDFNDADQDRIFNVSGVDTCWMYLYNKVNVVRSLPYFGVPAGLSPGSV